MATMTLSQLLSRADGLTPSEFGNTYGASITISDTPTTALPKVVAINEAGVSRKDVKGPRISHFADDGFHL